MRCKTNVLLFWRYEFLKKSLQWRHNEYDGVSNHQPHDCLLNRLFRRRSKKKSKLRVTGLCEGNSTVTGEIPAPKGQQRGNVSIWWRHHDLLVFSNVGNIFSYEVWQGHSEIIKFMRTSEWLVRRWYFMLCCYLLMFHSRSWLPFTRFDNWRCFFLMDIAGVCVIGNIRLNKTTA